MNEPGRSAVSRRSLAGRLARNLALPLLALWIIMMISVAVTVRHELRELYDSGLIAIAEALATAEGSSLDVRAIDGFGSDELEHDLFRYRERAPTGNDGALPRFVERDDERLLLLQPGGAGTRVVELSQDVDERREAIVEIATAVVLPILVILPLGLLGLAIVLRHELAPVEELGRELERRDADDLSALPALPLPSELKGVSDAMNRLLERLRRALDAERGFAASSAHELRTPIAGALAQTQRLIAETGGADAHGATTEQSTTLARARKIETSLKQLQRLATRLLELARADGAGIVTEHATDSARVVRLVIDEFMRDDPGRRLRADLEDAPLNVRLDPDAVFVLLRNLVENALRHGDPNEPVQVVRRGRTITVENGGSAISALEFKRLCQRFVRGRDKSSNDGAHDADGGGTGLGLATVDAICRGGGIDLELVSPSRADGSGVRIELTLPG